MKTSLSPSRRGFSLVEMMASVAIIGVIAFLAIPSVTKMREDSERNLAIARAEALNVAMSTFIQVNGRSQAQTLWASKATADDKYTLIDDYLSYAETSLSSFMPSGYTVTFDPTITNMKKSRLFGPSPTTGSTEEIKY